MALDAVARRYADALFHNRSVELGQQYVAHRALVIDDLARRGFDGHNAGFYHSELTRVGIAHIDDLIQARADTLRAAYEQARLPIDNEAVAYIQRETNIYADAQVRNLTRVIHNQLAQFNRPAQIAQHLIGRIEHAISGTKARITFQLSALRDEAILQARSAAPPEVTPPPAAPAPSPVIPTPIVSPTKGSIVGDIRKQARQIWDASARWDLLTLVFVVGTGGLLVLGEYALAVICFFCAGFGLTSRIAHHDSTSGWKKLLFSVLVVIVFAVAVYIVNDVRGTQPWSHLEKLLGNRNAASQTIDVRVVLSQHLKPPEPPEFALIKSPRPRPIIPTTKASETTPSTTIIETAPTYGNLKQRTINLANEIMSDLYSNGWPLPRGVEPGPGIQPMPTDQKEMNLWVHFRSGTFRWKCFKRVVVMRDDFAHLNIRDEDLDDIIEREQNYQREYGGNFPTWPDLYPIEIQEIAERLVKLSNELPAQ